MQSKGQGVFGSRVAVAITAVIVTAVVASGVAAANVPLNSVNSAKIVNGSIQRIDLANNVINSAKIANGTVTNADLAPGTRTRSASFSDDGLNIQGNGANQIAATVNINAPAAGQLLITASMRPDVTVTDVYGCAILVDGGFRDGTSRQVEAEFTAPETGCSTNDGVDVTAGNHTVELQVSGTDPGNQIDWASVQVLFVPAA